MISEQNFICWFRIHCQIKLIFHHMQKNIHVISQVQNEEILIELINELYSATTTQRGSSLPLLLFTSHWPKVNIMQQKAYLWGGNKMRSIVSPLGNKRGRFRWQFHWESMHPWLLWQSHILWSTLLFPLQLLGHCNCLLS